MPLYNPSLVFPVDYISHENQVLTEKVFSELFHIDQINTLNGISIDKEQNIKNLLNKKLVHVVAIIKVLELLDNEPLSKDIIKAVTLFELVTVDYADTLAEIEPMRGVVNQMYLLDNILDSCFTARNYNFFPEYVLKQEKEYRLHEWNRYLNWCASEFRNTMESYQVWKDSARYIKRRVHEFHLMIAAAHSRNREFKKNVINNEIKLADLNHWKQIPDWIDEREKSLWIFSFGDSISFILPLKVVMGNKNINVNYIRDLLISYASIGVLNYVLDDMIDIEEDNSRSDFNITRLALEGKYNRTCKKISKRFNLKMENNIETILVASVLQFKQDIERLQTKYPAVKYHHHVMAKEMIALYIQLGVNKRVGSLYLEMMRKAYTYAV